MFDFSDSNDELSSVLFQHRKKLHCFAERSLLDATDDIDLYLKNSLNFIRRLVIDPIQGGCYFPCHKGYRFDTFKNVILSEYLLIADKVFYTGELSYLALQILKALEESMLCQESGWFSSELTYSYQALPFVVRGNKLLRSLNVQEQYLLVGLIEEASIESHQDYLLHYKCSLLQASKKTSIHFKQAQVLDCSIREKLSSLQKKFYLSSEVKREPDLMLNAQILLTYTQAIIWHEMCDLIQTAKQVFNRLYCFITQKNLRLLSMEQLIHMCYALVEFLQVKLDRHYLVEIAHIFSLRILLDESSMVLIQSGQKFEGLRSKVYALIQVFDYFKVLDISWEKSWLKELVKLEERGGVYQVLVLSKTHFQCQAKQRVFAKYHSRLKVFLEA